MESSSGNSNLKHMLQKLVTQTSQNLIKLDKVQTLVSLLQQAPASKELVLNQFGSFFVEVTNVFVGRDYKNKKVDTCLNITALVFNERVENGGVYWAQILSTWVIQTIERIIHSLKTREIYPSPTNIPATLNFYLKMAPMQILVDIYMKSLKILIANKVETSIDSLLNAPPPFFDWLVVDVGNTFPDTIVERVFHSGFNKFCQVKWGGNEAASGSKGKSPSIEKEHMVLTSVIRILKHLNFNHRHEVTNVMFTLFQNPPGSTTNGKMKAMLYLVGLFGQAPHQFQHTALMLVKNIDVAVLNKLYDEYKSLVKSQQETKLIQKSVISLICSTKEDSYKFLKLIIDAASGDFPQLNKRLQILVKDMVPDFLRELQMIASGHSSNMGNHNNMGNQNKNMGSNNNIGVFEGFYTHHEEMIANVLTTANTEKRDWLEYVLTLVCMHKVNSYHAITILAYLLRQSTSRQHADMFLRMYDGVSQLYPNLLEKTLRQYFEILPTQSNAEATQMLENVLRLMTIVSTMENENRKHFVDRLHRSVTKLMDELLIIIGRGSSSIPLCHVCLQLLSQIFSKPIKSTALRFGTRNLSITQKLVNYFFRLLRLGFVNNDKEMQTCHQVIITLSGNSENNFQIICQYLLESALSDGYSTLFGKRIDPMKSVNINEPSLLQQLDVKRKNLDGHDRYSPATMIAVEMDLLGRGAKRYKKCPISQEEQDSNKNCLVLLLTRICCNPSAEDVVKLSPPTSKLYDSDKLKLLAANLMSSIASSSPHLATSITMDGDLDWPHPQFRKLTIERDLKVFHFIQEHAFVWHIISLLAFNSDALWQATPLLRSCMSVLISHYENRLPDSRPNFDTPHYICAIELVKVLAKGEFIPAPLKYVGELFHHINNYDIFVIFSIMWTYIKENTLLAIENKRPLNNVPIQPYLTPVQAILHRNITTLHHLYLRFTPKQETR